MGTFLILVFALLIAVAIIGYFFVMVSDSDHKSGKVLRAARAKAGLDNLFGAAPDLNYLAESRAKYAAANPK